MIKDICEIGGVNYPESLESEVGTYPMEVSVTGAALKKITQCYFNNLYSKIDIWAAMKSGKSQRVCTLNSGLFGLMMKYNIVFKSCDACVPCLDNSIYEVYHRLLINYSFLDALTQRPRLENNFWNIPSLVFPVPSFKIERPEFAKVSLFDYHSFSVRPEEECTHDRDRIMSLSPVYIIGKPSFAQEHFMEVKFSATVAPNFLRMEMDYQDGEWKLVAIQRKQVEPEEDVEKDSFLIK
ncbi:MAG: hypothetical protein H0W50_00045 [Parachlamydiaceae bacterium]|nr:hypothetical protein [Parachlamydiaceae bacterium]